MPEPMPPAASSSALAQWVPSIGRFKNLIRNYGALSGAEIFFRLRKKRGQAVTIRLPALIHPRWEVTLRPSSADSSVFEQVFLDRLYNGGFLGPIETIVDGGAHIGCASLFFASQHPAARVIAIEPEPGNFGLLRRNTSQSDRITAIHAALWPRDGQLEIHPDARGSTWGFSVAEDRDGGGTIRAISMPSLMREFGIDTIDLLKLDIEGAEKELFGAATEEWLPRVRNILIETHERIYPGSDTAVRSALSDFGGTVRIFEE